MSHGNAPDPDDMFSDTRMTFGEHLEELRIHLWRAIVGFMVGLVFSVFFIGRPVMNTLIIEPIEDQLRRFQERRHEELMKNLPTAGHELNERKPIRVAVSRQQIAALVKGEQPPEPPEEVDEGDLLTLSMFIQNPAEAWRVFDPVATRVGRQATMKTMNVTEAFVVYFKISVYTGVVLSSPWLFWQIWSFVAAGLYPHEKRYVHYYLPFSLGLFLTGVVFCQFIVLPRAVEALLWFNHWLNLEPDLRLNEWLSFALAMPLVFGISFQTPLVMLFLERLGVFDVEAFQQKRSIAFFVLAILSALGPSIDLFSMLAMWGSLCLLYQLGIWLIQLSPRPKLDLDVPDSEEMVEV